LIDSLQDRKTSKFLPQLHIIRAIASLSVAIFHLGGKAIPVLNYGWMGVQMFFVLTGFVICWSLPENYKLLDFPRFLVRRVVRIEPPYICSIILIIVLSYFVYHNSNNINLKNVLFHLAYINNFLKDDYLSPVYWTLGIEFQFYVLIGMLFPYLFHSKYSAILSLLFLNILSFYWIVEYSFVLNFISYFTLGILSYMYKTKKIERNEFFGIATLLLFYMYFHIGPEPTAVSLLTCIIIVFISKSNIIIDFFSRISFSLYLTHDIVGSQLVIFFGDLFQTKNIYTKAFAFSIGLAAAILFAYVFHILIEKKALKLSKYFKYRTLTKV
jgi:peptidoglycan/LPS O-acetylase OafA/YrhL